MNGTENRMFGLTIDEINAMLQTMGQPQLTPGALAGLVASGLIHVSPETQRVQKQQQQIRDLNQKQQTRLRAYIDQGLDFDSAYTAVQRTDPVVQADIKLATLNLPPIQPPRGRRLTRRQRRKT